MHNSIVFKPNPFKLSIARSFSKAANSYNDNAIFQQEVGQRLLQRLTYTKINPIRILDLGSGTGVITKQLSAMYPQAEIIAVDLAEGMLKYAKSKSKTPNFCSLCCADAEQLPFNRHSFDLIFSNLALQWTFSLEKIFKSLHTLLKSDGLLLFSTLGRDTLKELRHAWSQVDDKTHVNNFTDMHLVGDAMMQSKLIDPVTDMEILTLTYDSVYDMLQELKLTGANTVCSVNKKNTISKNSLKKMSQIYVDCFKQNEVIPASFEIIYGQAWGTPDNLL